MHITFFIRLNAFILVWTVFTFCMVDLAHLIDNTNSLASGIDTKSRFDKNPILQNYILVNNRNPLKVEIIREFLSVKYFQYFDLISVMIYSEFQSEINELKGKYHMDL